LTFISSLYLNFPYLTMVSKIKMKLWNSFIYDVGKKVSQKP